MAISKENQYLAKCTFILLNYAIISQLPANIKFESSKKFPVETPMSHPYSATYLVGVANECIIFLVCIKLILSDGPKTHVMGI